LLRRLAAILNGLQNVRFNVNPDAGFVEAVGLSKSIATRPCL